MKNTMSLPALSFADAAWLSKTLERNKALFGGWRMDGGDGSGDGGSGGDGGTGGDGGNGGQGGGGSDKGFPANTPVAEMTPAQQAAYGKDRSQTHETRNKDLLKITGGKYGDALKADVDELEKLRQQNQTDSEKAVEEAKKAGRAEGARESGLDAARMAFEFALGHDPEKNDQSTLIDTLDLSKVLTDDGKVDTAKVRTVVAQIAPADKGRGSGKRDADYGGGRREGGDGKTGIKTGRDLYADRHKKSETK